MSERHVHRLCPWRQALHPCRHAPGLAPRGEVLEYVGLGMAPVLSVDQGSLHIQSDGAAR